MRAKLEILVGPRIDHAPDLLDTSSGHRQAVIRQKANDTADASLRFRDQKPLLDSCSNSSISGFKRSEIIVEDESALVYRVADSAGTGICPDKDNNSDRSESG